VSLEVDSGNKSRCPVDHTSMHKILHYDREPRRIMASLTGVDHPQDLTLDDFNRSQGFREVT
jgi:hypothetical protein